MSEQDKRGNEATTIAVIEKSPSAQLRVGISSRRGCLKLEVREATATIPGIFMPTHHGISIDIAKLPELVAALQAAAEAISKGMIRGSKR